MLKGCLRTNAPLPCSPSEGQINNNLEWKLIHYIDTILCLLLCYVYGLANELVRETLSELFQSKGCPKIL